MGLRFTRSLVYGIGRLRTERLMLWLFPLIKTTCPRTQACEGQGLPRDLTNPGVGGEGYGPTLQTRTAGKGARMNDMGRLRGRLDPAPASWACRPLASWEPPAGLAGPRDTRGRDGREVAFRLPEGQPSRDEFMPLGFTISLRGSDHPPVVWRAAVCAPSPAPPLTHRAGSWALGW